MKWEMLCKELDEIAESHPARGAWIEIVKNTVRPIASSRRTPQGVRGLKSLHMRESARSAAVAPRKGCVD